MRLLERASLVEGELGKLVADARGSISTLAESVRDGADKLRTELDIPREERSSGRFARTGQSPGRRAHGEAGRARRPGCRIRGRRADSAGPPEARSRGRPGVSAVGDHGEARGGSGGPESAATPAPAAPDGPAAPAASAPRPPLPPPSRGWAGARLPATPRLRPPRSGASARPWSRPRTAPREPKAESTPWGSAEPHAGRGTAPCGVQHGPRWHATRRGGPHLKEKFGLEDATEILDDVFNRAGS